MSSIPHLQIVQVNYAVPRNDDQGGVSGGYHAATRSEVAEGLPRAVMPPRAILNGALDEALEQDVVHGLQHVQHVAASGVGGVKEEQNAQLLLQGCSCSRR